MKPKIHIASCSFGKDSIATILLALENNEALDRVVFSEVMFDISRGISGEIPEHIEWIYSTAIPKLEQMAMELCRKYNLVSPIYRTGTRGGCWFCPNAKIKSFAELKNNHPHLWQELVELSKESNLISQNFKYGMTLQEVERKINLIEINNKLQLRLEL